MRIIRCNKCNTITNNELEFTQVNIYFPEKKRTRPRTWDEEEKLADEADYIDKELVKNEPTKLNELEIHLCPKHTLWFQQIFETDIRQIRRRLR